MATKHGYRPTTCNRLFRCCNEQVPPPFLLRLNALQRYGQLGTSRFLTPFADVGALLHFS